VALAEAHRDDAERLARAVDVGVAAQPAAPVAVGMRIAHAERPDVLAREVGLVRVRVRDLLDDVELALVPEALQVVQAVVQLEAAVQVVQRLAVRQVAALELDVRPPLVVRRQVGRDHHVEAVVAAQHVDHDHEAARDAGDLAVHGARAHQGVDGDRRRAERGAAQEAPAGEVHVLFRHGSYSWCPSWYGAISQSRPRTFILSSVASFGSNAAPTPSLT
jgi:hypothetical protein